MKILKINFIVLLLLLIVQSVFGQFNIDNDSLSKTNFTPEFITEKSQKNTIIYDNPNQDLKLDYKPLAAKPLSLQQDKGTKQHYLKFGFGTLKNKLLELNVQTPVSKSNLNVVIAYQSAENTKWQKHQHVLADIHIITPKAKSSLLYGISFLNKQQNRFALNPFVDTISNSSNLLKTNYNIFQADIQSIANKKKQEKNYTIWSASTFILNGISNIKETNFTINVERNIFINKHTKFYINANGQLGQLNSDTTISELNYFKPGVGLKWNKENTIFDAHIAEAIASNKNYFLYNFYYNHSFNAKKLQLIANIKSELINKTWNNILAQNEFVHSNNQQLNIGALYQYNFGILYEVIPALVCNAQLGIQQYKNGISFINQLDNFQNNPININYIDVNTIQQKLDALYKINSDFQIGQNIVLTQFTKNRLQHVPTIYSNTYCNALIKKKLSIKSNFIWMHGIQGQDQNKAIQNLQAYSDVHLELGWWLRKNFNLFVQINNALNNQNMRFWNYNSYNRNYTVGIIYKKRA